YDLSDRFVCIETNASLASMRVHVLPLNAGVEYSRPCQNFFWPIDAQPPLEEIITRFSIQGRKGVFRKTPQIQLCDPLCSDSTTSEDSTVTINRRVPQDAITALSSRNIGAIDKRLFLNIAWFVRIERHPRAL